MNKIPIGQTIIFAYTFLFAHIGTVIVIAWFPALLTGAAGYLARSYAISHRAALDAEEPGVAGVYFVISLATLLCMIFASSVVAVGVTRQALGLRGGEALFYFPMARSEWRMFAANLRYFVGAGVLMLLALAIAAIAFVLAGAPLDAPERPEPTLSMLLAAMISWAVFAYAFFTILRMGFLLPAVIVAEEAGGLRRAHDLTQGNFWRAFAVMGALGVPILLLLMAGEAAVLHSAVGPEFTRLPPIELMRRLGEATQERMLPWQIFTAVVFVLASGLIYSGTAFAYRALVPTGSQPRARAPVTVDGKED